MAIRVTDYTQAHLNAWAAKHNARTLWENKLEQQYFFVAEQSGEILGFISLDTNAWLDLLYVAPQAQRQGVAAKLLEQTEMLASHLNFPQIWVDASVIARDFFIVQGFMLNEVYPKSLGNLTFMNSIMFKYVKNTHA
ncbi:MAG: GNAT family N-acetyltransferase [Thiotrichaceae bacterium]|nr:GNAT family N-acetyltransferase [Thiotrichaceae bacterium]